MSWTDEPSDFEIPSIKEDPMKAFVMLKIGEVGIVEKERPTCGPLDLSLIHI